MSEETIRQTRPTLKRAFYVLLVTLVGILIAIFTTVVYITSVSRERQRDTCEVITAQRAVFNETPPATEAGRNAAKAWNHLWQSLGCEEIAKVS